MPLDHYTPRIGVMVSPKFGVSDTGETALRFTLHAADGMSSSQWIFDMEEVVAILKASGLDDVNKLHGRPCWYTVENSIMRFRGPFPPKYENQKQYGVWPDWAPDAEKVNEEHEHLLTLHWRRQEEQEHERKERKNQ